MQIEVLPATKEEEPVLANLLELYAYDFSEFCDLKIRADGGLAGFALVQQGSQVAGAADTWDLAEFFVLRRYRRHRVGITAAHAVWRMFPGRWEVRVMENSEVARIFWHQAISEFTGLRADPALMEAAGKRWHVFALQSAHGG